MVKKWYYGNESLGLAWDRMKVPHMTLLYTTILGPKKDNLFFLVLVFRGVMSHAISDLVLYLQSGGLNIS